MLCLFRKPDNVQSSLTQWVLVIALSSVCSHFFLQDFFFLKLFYIYNLFSVSGVVQDGDSPPPPSILSRGKDKKWGLESSKDPVVECVAKLPASWHWFYDFWGHSFISVPVSLSWWSSNDYSYWRSKGIEKLRCLYPALVQHKPIENGCLCW